MSRKIFAIRPQPGLEATLTSARELGLDIYGEPLFEIQSVPWTAPDPDTFDGLLIGSGNAIRHGGPQLVSFRSKPVHAVGRTTAAIAAKAGFDVEQIGSGGLQSLLDAHKNVHSARYRYLRLCGAERVALETSAEIVVEERIVYRAIALGISPELEKRLRSGGIVLLHSAAAARHFSDECARFGIPKAALCLAALGPRIAVCAGEGWAEVRHAITPDEIALLALVKHMCQDR